MTFWLAALEALLLVTALSIDAFVASFAYGTSRIKIPLHSAVVITAICALLLGLGLGLSALISPYIPDGLTQGVCFAILFLLGIVKLCDSTIKTLIKKHNRIDKKFRFSMFSLSFILNVYADPAEADEDRSQELSPAEAASLAVALSLDGLAVGFGAGLTQVNILLTIGLALLVGMLAVITGCRLGNRIAAKSDINLSWLSGVMLMLLAFLKL